MSDVAASATSSLLPSAIDFPALKDHASGISARAQRKVLWTIRIQLCLAVILSLLGDASSLPPASAGWLRRARDALAQATGWTWLDILGSNDQSSYALIPHLELWFVTVLIVVVILLGLVYIHRDKEQFRLWFQARAGAESVKTATWRLMMSAHPFRAPASVETFPRVVRRILEGNPLLRGVVDTTDPNILEPTRTNLYVRGLRDWRDRREIYRVGRLENQIHWYSRGSASSRMRARRYRSWVSLVWGAAICLACFRALATSLWGLDVNLVGTAGALAAALVAWAEAKRFEELGASYGAAARELEEIRLVLTGAQDEESFVRAVVQCEQAISREHTMWVAKSNLPGLLPESYTHTASDMEPL